MAVSIPDRDSNYMKKMWGTTKLVTDYGSNKVLREVMYDSENIDSEVFKNDFEYGVEPFFKFRKRDKKLL